MADSEVRQKFEAWYLKTPLIDERPKSELQWESWQAGMRAGEIARWIPVEEKSPEITRTWTDCGNVYRQSDELLIFDSVVGRRTGCFYGPGWSGSEGDKLTSVTHWQPLPAAPEEKKSALSGAKESKK